MIADGIPGNGSLPVPVLRNPERKDPGSQYAQPGRAAERMMTMQRSSGILMPVFSLPSPYGIGTLGQAARDFVDFLKKAGQSWWQILPVGPTGYGNSPYQSFSAYAGNPYLIDPDLLREDGLLEQRELDGLFWGADPGQVDYGALYQNRLTLLESACLRGWARDRQAVERFSHENRGWLPDYALFMALKRHFHGEPWTSWPEDIRRRRPEAVARYEKELAADIRLFTYLQFLFFRQWDALRRYAVRQGVGILGDLPIYVAMDSADVWADPGSFLLDENLCPSAVAGVPPDYFAVDGQLWGNPLYNWEAMKADGFGWWIRRIDGARRLYDLLRLDHFRGFERYWAVPYGAATARTGHWQPGPGMDLLRVLTGWFPDIQLIAEDLGQLTPEVHALRDAAGLPGMKVLEFAFDPEGEGAYLPHNHVPGCVCYTGTHDNAPLAAWLTEAEPKELAMAQAYLGLNEEEGPVWGLLRGGMGSVAELFVAQLQDYLELGADSRINIPGTAEGNWQWRLTPGLLTDALAERIRAMTRRFGRLPAGRA